MKQNDLWLVTCANPDADFLAFNQGSLREHRDRSVEYVIPLGDWFDIVSSPHYLAEMVVLSLSLSLVDACYALFAVKVMTITSFLLHR